MRALLLLLAVSSGLLASGPTRAETQPIVADLSERLVAITTGFAGTDVLLFGATGAPGDVVVVVRGPMETQVIRRMARFGFIWANRNSVTFADVPSFYAVASTRPVEDLLSPSALQAHQIGAANLKVTPIAGERDDPEILALYRRALERLKIDDDLYRYAPQGVQHLSNRLFRTDLHLPANVPVGNYTVEVYLVHDGEVVSAESTPLIVSKIGVGAEVYYFAHHQSALYGIVAILVAVFAGWVAAAVFRKR